MAPEFKAVQRKDGWFNIMGKNFSSPGDCGIRPKRFVKICAATDAEHAEEILAMYRKHYKVG